MYNNEPLSGDTMNKRANLYLNLFGFVFFILAFIFFILTMRIEGMNKTIYILRNITFLLTFATGSLFILTEILLFMLLKNNYRVLYVFYFIAEVVTASLLNIKFMFSFPIVFIIFKMIKDMYRINYVDKIYRPRVFNKYCKMFNIKIKDYPKSKRKSISLRRKDTLLNNKELKTRV